MSDKHPLSTVTGGEGWGKRAHLFTFSLLHLNSLVTILYFARQFHGT